MRDSFRFGLYQVDFDSGQLLKRGVRVKLRFQPFQILEALLERPGKIVSRDTLRQRLWGDDVIVDFENNLNSAIAELRQVLGDSSDHPRYIETVPKRGYRFVGDVSVSIRPKENSRSRLVVLPFMNTCADPNEEYFSDAATDEIITALASIAPEKLAVIARTTSMHYKHSRKDVAKIARELNVDYLVEGGISRTDGRVALNVQLIAACDETHLFSKKFDGDLAGIFNLYTGIAEGIANHLPLLHNSEQSDRILFGQKLKKPTEDLAAYNDFIQGRYHMSKWTPEGITRAKEYFESALARDPKFAMACNALAELYWYMGFWGFAPSSEIDRVGRFYVMRALEIDPGLAETHALLSCYPKQLHPNGELRYFDWPVQLKDAEYARKLNPTSPTVMLRYSIIQMAMGRTNDAAAELQKALEIDPLSPDLRAWLSQILCLGRRYEEALEQATQLLELNPENPLAHSLLGLIQMAKREFEASIGSLHRAVELTGGSIPVPLGWLALASGLGGFRSEACAILNRLDSMAKQRYIPPTCFAWAHLGLGNFDEAFVWMERGVDKPDRMMAALKTYPFLDPLRSDPRFVSLLRRMNLVD